MSVFHDYYTGFSLRPGMVYMDGHGDMHGPMEERTPGTWIDQHGAVFHANGIQLNHTWDSAGNLRPPLSGSGQHE